MNTQQVESMPAAKALAISNGYAIQYLLRDGWITQVTCESHDVANAHYDLIGRNSEFGGHVRIIDRDGNVLRSTLHNERNNHE